MGKLTGQTIAASYDQLLMVTAADGISGSLQAIESPDTGGSSSSLKISTSKCEVIPASDSTAIFEVSTNGGNPVLSVDTSNQRVGIGLSAPGTDLHIESSVSEKPVLTLENTTNDADKPGITFYNNRGAGNAATNDECGIINFNALNNNNDAHIFAAIKAIATNIADGGEESSIQFSTGDSAGGYNHIYMNQGRLGIGTATPGVPLVVYTGTAVNNT